MEWMDKIELLDQQIVLLLNGSNNPFFDQLMWLVTNLIFGISFSDAFCVVPPKPVTLQNKSYNGTAAKDKANIKRNIETKATGVKFFLLMVIKFLYYKFQYCKR